MNVGGSKAGGDPKDVERGVLPDDLRAILLILRDSSCSRPIRKGMTTAVRGRAAKRVEMSDDLKEGEAKARIAQGPAGDPRGHSRSHNASTSNTKDVRKP